MEALVLPAVLDSLQRLSDFAHQAALRCGLDEHAAWEVQLAVDEAVTNIIQHAYPERSGEIRISCNCQGQGQAFAVTIHDEGIPFNPEAVPTPDLSSPLEEREAGGLGMYLMRRLMDEVEYRFDPSAGNDLLMLKRRSAALPADVRFVPLSGRIDAATAPRLTEQIRAIIAEGGLRLVLDFSQVSFLSSSGLRMLLLLARELKQLRGQMHLCGLPPHIAEVFELTGFYQIFPIHRTYDEALVACQMGETP